jgi:hypothetical protein
MELATIELDVDEAKERYKEYSAAVKRRHDDEDAAIAAGYKALAEGKSLISLRGTIAAGGVDELGRPNLALAPANCEWIWLGLGTGWRGGRDLGTGSATFSVTPNPGPTRGRPSLRRRIHVPAGTLANTEIEVGWQMARYRYRAMVPIVPAKLRPTRALTTYHVLFEAEWAIDPTPPVDPALLQHLRGDLWMVLAVWDLTPLERAVLGERLLAEGS